MNFKFNPRRTERINLSNLLYKANKKIKINIHNFYCCKFDFCYFCAVQISIWVEILYVNKRFIHVVITKMYNCITVLYEKFENVSGNNAIFVKEDWTDFSIRNFLAVGKRKRYVLLNIRVFWLLTSQGSFCQSFISLQYCANE